MRCKAAIVVMGAIGLAMFVNAPAADAAGVKIERDIRYVPDGDAAQALDLYLPEATPDKPLPVIVYIHGGGWSAGSKSGGGSERYVAQGYAAASIEYRFSQKAKFPAQIQDCQAAIRWLRANSAKYHLDPERIGAWGDSAGGHLVALLGTSGGKKAFPAIGGNEEQSDRVQAVVDIYGPTDFFTVAKQAEDDKNVRNIFKWNSDNDPYGKLIGGGVGEDKEKCHAVSPVSYVSKDNPPFLILHGDHDQMVPLAQSEELTADLEKAGVPVVLQRIPGAQHGGPQFGLTGVQKLVESFFDKYLKGADVKIEALPESEFTAPKK